MADEEDKPGLFTRAKQAVSGKIQERTEKGQAQMFIDMTADMVAMEKFNFREFHDMYQKIGDKSGASGWRSKVPFAGKDAGLQQMQKMLGILGSMTPLEQEQEQMALETKSRISRQQKVSIQEMNKIIKMYGVTKNCWVWLKRREKKGGSIPQSQDEMELMMREDPPPPDKLMMARYRNKQKRHWTNKKHFK